MKMPKLLSLIIAIRTRERKKGYRKLLAHERSLVAIHQRDRVKLMSDNQKLLDERDGYWKGEMKKLQDKHDEEISKLLDTHDVEIAKHLKTIKNNRAAYHYYRDMAADVDSVTFDIAEGVQRIHATTTQLLQFFEALKHRAGWVSKRFDSKDGKISGYLAGGRK